MFNCKNYCNFANRHTSGCAFIASSFLPSSAQFNTIKWLHYNIGNNKGCICETNLVESCLWIACCEYIVAVRKIIMQEPEYFLVAVNHNNGST